MAPYSVFMEVTTILFSTQSQGLSPEISCLDQLRLINRHQETPHEGAFCDLVWSDPEPDIETWQVSQRGAGWLFGSKVTKEVFLVTSPFLTFQFCNINRLELVCRSHQLVDEGYKYYFDKTLVTVWSAPNYCYRSYS